jgi:hypothetical protein
LSGLQDLAPAVAGVMGAAAIIFGAQSTFAGIDPDFANLMRSLVDPDVLEQLDKDAAETFPPLPDMPIPGED